MPGERAVGRTAVTTLAAASVLLAAAAPTGRAQTIDCAWYAATAMKQQQENLQRKCGFTGPDWSFDRRAHAAWCATQAPDRWKREAQRRHQMLTTCRR
jgi:hypothetical protein